MKYILILGLVLSAGQVFGNIEKTQALIDAQYWSTDTQLKISEAISSLNKYNLTKTLRFLQGSREYLFPCLL